MAKKMKVRAFMNDSGTTVVKAILYHPMETGLRKDKTTGEVIPAHFIEKVTVTLNNAEIMSADWGTAVSKNPFLSFDISGTKAGDKVAIAWLDNQGATESAEATIS